MRFISKYRTEMSKGTLVFIILNTALYITMSTDITYKNRTD